MRTTIIIGVTAPGPLAASEAGIYEQAGRKRHGPARRAQPKLSRSKI
jgi:hypothetical protein